VPILAIQIKRFGTSFEFPSVLEQWPVFPVQSNNIIDFILAFMNVSTFFFFFSSMDYVFASGCHQNQIPKEINQKMIKI
jgi:hypothetical protein